MTGSRKVSRKLGAHVTVFAWTLLFFFPFLVMLFTAFKSRDEVFSSPPELLPRTWTLENFQTVWESVPVVTYLINTLVIAGACVVGTALVAPLVSYSLSKVNWRGSRFLFLGVLATMMLPPQVTLIPLYMMWSNLGLTNTFVPLIVPSFLGIPFFVFLVRQFMMGVPEDLLNAARIDGANEWQIYWRIVLPLVRPAVITSMVFQFVWAWTDFFLPLVYLNDSSLHTLSIGLYAFFGQQGLDWGPLMAACVLFTIPAVAVFLLAQKYFIGGAMSGALK